MDYNEVMFDAGKMRQAQAKAGIGNAALAVAAGVGRTYISQLRRGARQPAEELVERLADALKVTPTELMGEPSAPADANLAWLIETYHHLDIPSRIVLLDTARNLGRDAPPSAAGKSTAEEA